MRGPAGMAGPGSVSQDMPDTCVPSCSVLRASAPQSASKVRPPSNLVTTFGTCPSNTPSTSGTGGNSRTTRRAASAGGRGEDRARRRTDVPARGAAVAAASGLGLALVQLAALSGAEVYGAASAGCHAADIEPLTSGLCGPRVGPGSGRRLTATSCARRRARVLTPLSNQWLSRAKRGEAGSAWRARSRWRRVEGPCPPR